MQESLRDTPYADVVFIGPESVVAIIVGGCVFAILMSTDRSERMTRDSVQFELYALSMILVIGLITALPTLGFSLDYSGVIALFVYQATGHGLSLSGVRKVFAPTSKASCSVRFAVAIFAFLFASLLLFGGIDLYQQRQFQTPFLSRQVWLVTLFALVIGSLIGAYPRTQRSNAR